MADPILVDLPQTTRRLTGTYSPSGVAGDPVLGNLLPANVAALRRFDVDRAISGRPTLSSTQRAAAGLSLERGGQPVIPEPKKGGWGGFVSNALGNVTDIVGALPKLPMAIAQEASQLPQLGEMIGDATREGDSLIEDIGNVATLPGLNMIPGAFVASSFGTPGYRGMAGGGVSNLLENPVFTALDVLPYATKAVKSTKTVKAAEQAARSYADASGTLPQRVRPYTTFAKNWRPGGPKTRTARAAGVQEIIDPDTGAVKYAPAADSAYTELVPNPVGEWLQGRGKRLSKTSGGRLARQAFGRQARETTRVTNRGDYEITRLVADPEYAAQFGPLVEEAARQFRELGDESIWAGMDEAQIGAINQALLVGDDAALAALDDTGRAFVDEYRRRSDRLRDELVADGELVKVNVGGADEVYDVATARTVTRAQRQVEKATADKFLDDVLQSPGSAPVDVLATHLRKVLDDTDLSHVARRNYARAYLEALDDAGVDVAAARDALKQVRKADDLAGWRAAHIDNLDLTSTGPRVLDVDQWVSHLRPFGRSQPVARLIGYLRDGNWSAARKESRYLAKSRSTNPIPGIDTLDDTLAAFSRSQRARTAWQKSAFGGRADAGRILRRAEKQRTRIEQTAVPARFMDAVGERAREVAKERVRTGQTATPVADVDAALQAIDDGVWQNAGMSPAEINKIRSEVRATWQQLRADGLEPTYIHRVTPGEAMRRTMYPKALDFEPNLKSVKQRLWDASPTVNNPMIALRAQAAEVLIREASEKVISDVRSSMAVTGGQLTEQLYPAARRIAEETGQKVNVVLEDLIQSEWTRWEPGVFKSPTRPSVGAVDPNQQLFVPKDVSDTLARLKPSPDDLGAMLDAPMRIFRTSLLPLSPRWHLYNIVGGAVMATIASPNPIRMWTRAYDAWQLAKQAQDGLGVAAIDDLAQPGGRLAQEGNWFRGADKAKRAADAYHYRGGATLRRLHDQARESRVADLARRGVQKSYDINQLFDDFYRSMVYLEGEASALGKNMPKQAARREGIALARKILQEWDTLTPLERSSMRFVMPFYSWTRTLLKFVTAYPIDHPWRMAVMSSLARTEMEDHMSGVPQQLKSLLFLGEPDEDGNVKAVNLAGMNPFRDVSNYASAVGFFASGGKEGNLASITANLNPALGTFLQWVGVDPSSGQAELFPDVAYDPVTGKLRANAATNPLLAPVQNFLPQTRALTGLLGQNAEFKAMMQSDPDAAMRVLLSSVGVPANFRTVNLPEEQIEAELRRLDAFQQTKSQAMRTGDLSLFDQYPGLEAFRQRAEALQQSGQYAPPTPDRSSMGEALVSSLTPL